MQKNKVSYAKYPTNAKILDYFIKSLEIEQKDAQQQVMCQRFVKEERISIDEYKHTFQTLISDIFDSIKITNNKEFYRNLFSNFFSYFNLLKLTNETLNCSQKQLDYIIIMDILIPFSVFFNTLQKITIVDLLPTYRYNSIQILFEIISTDLKSDAKNFKKNLFSILDNPKNKLLGYNAINKNISNWIEGKTLPSKQHLKLISKMASKTLHFTEDELFRLLLLAKFIQEMYEKSIQYFGNALTELLLKHFKLIVTLLNNPHISTYNPILTQYYNFYIKLNKLLFQKIYSAGSVEDFYDEQYSTTIQNIIKKSYREHQVFYEIEEDTFFRHIHTILPVKYLLQEIPYRALIQFKYTEKPYNKQFYSIYKQTSPEKTKDNQLQKIVEKEIKAFQTKYEIQEDPYFAFLQARYFAQLREYKQATAYYLLALKYGKNIMGAHIKSIIEEGLIVSAQTTRNNTVDLQNAKSDFTKFVKEAYFYGLFTESSKNKSEYLLNDMKKQFDIYFTKLFPSAKSSNTNLLTPNYALVYGDRSKIKIDFNQPNKLLRKDLPNPITQLMHCAGQGNYDAVKRLLQHGADANQLKSSDNASALIFALQNYQFESSTKKNKLVQIMQLLIPRMNKKAINTKLIKKQESALSYAIQFGLTGIVKLLLKHEADLAMKTTLDEQTPLYLTIQYIALAKRNQLIPKDYPFITTNPLTSKREIAKLSKANSLSSNIFDEDKKKEIYDTYNNSSPLCLDIEKNVEKIFMRNYQKNLYHYYEIFDVIVAASSKVDIAHKNNFTPLIFATEVNEETVAIKLLDKGANPDWYTDTHHRAYDYAQKNKNKKLMELLE